MKILFVCTGNICRSAMAEGLLKKIAKDNNVNIEVDSAGICAETGSYATYNAIAVSRDYNVDLTSHRAKNIKDIHIDEVDVILCATNSHKEYIYKNYPECREKTFTIKEYVHLDKNGSDIADPWSYDETIYKQCISEINMCLQKLIEDIKK